MPSERSARQSVRRYTRKQPTRSGVKTRVKAARQALDSGSPEDALDAVRKAESSLDQAVRKGTLHSNNSARRKSRLAKRLNAST